MKTKSDFFSKNKNYFPWLLLGLTAYASILPTVLDAGVLSLRTTVLCHGNRPDIAAYFEQTNGTSQAPQDCRFLYLTSDPTPQDLSDWQANTEALQTLTLTAQPPVSISNSMLRQNYIDSQGSIRKVTWTSPQGLETECALYNEKGYILRLDRWRNQTIVPNANLQPMICGPSTEHPLNIRIFSNTSGNLDAERRDLEYLADTVTNYALVHNLGLTTTAYTNGLHNALISNAASPGVDSKVGNSGLSWTFGKPLVVVPNPASDNVIIFYQLSNYFDDVEIAIYDLSGKIQKRYSQGGQNSGIYQLPVSVDGLSAGIYFVSLMGNGGTGEKLISMFKLAVRH